MEMEINLPVIPFDASGNGQTQNMAIFRPQSDMKPKLLQRGCTLKEISTFMTSFENYLSHGYQNKIPKGAVHSQILVCVGETRGLVKKRICELF